MHVFSTPFVCFLISAIARRCPCAYRLIFNANSAVNVLPRGPIDFKVWFAVDCKRLVVSQLDSKQSSNTAEFTTIIFFATISFENTCCSPPPPTRPPPLDAHIKAGGIENLTWRCEHATFCVDLKKEKRKKEKKKKAQYINFRSLIY